LSSPIIKISITASDETSAAFASAQARAQAFQQVASGSFREARASAKLLSDEVGVNLNRHLVSAMANSQALRGVLAGAFGVAVGAGFLSVAIQQGEKFYKILADSDFTAAHFDREGRISEILSKALEQGKQLNRQLELAMAPSAAARGQMEFGFKREDAEDAKLRIASLNRELVTMQTELARLNENPEFVLPHAITRLEANIHSKQMEIAEATLAQQNKGTEAEIAKVNAAKEYLRIQEETQKRLEAILAKQKELWRDWKPQDFTRGPVALQAISSDLPTQLGGYFSGQQANATPSMEVAARYAQRFRDITAVVDSTRTSSERYAAEVSRLNSLFSDAEKTSEPYRRALAGLKNQYDENARAWSRFGADVQENISSALVFQESWSQAFKSTAQELAKLVLQMYVFKALSKRFGVDDEDSDSGGSGGLFGAFLSGLTHHQHGGYVSPNSWAVVGEAGPELIRSGRGGLSVTPNGALGGTVINNYDFRGADPGSEMRLRMMLRETEQRATVAGANLALERQLRR
jgi:hypothetical protein